jgi:DNA invertase Pin-like site-specific DNA recombinase
MNPRFKALLDSALSNVDALPPIRAGDVTAPAPERPPIENLIERGRHSKEEKRKAGHSPIDSLRIQRTRLDEYAEQTNLRVVGWFPDENLSGDRFDEGDGWAKMVAYINRMPKAKRERTAVGFKSPDRLGRKLSKALQTVDTFHDLGLRVRFAEFPFLEPETPQGYLQLVDFLKMADFELFLIRTRTQEAVDERAHAGVHRGQDARHFSRDDEGRTVPDEIAEQIIDLRLAGHSYDEIAHRVSLPKNEVYAVAAFVRREAERMIARRKVKPRAS